MNLPLTTLEHFLLTEQRRLGRRGYFTGLMTSIATAAKVISREVRRAGLTSIAGAAETRNAHGEVQQKLDILANDLLCETVKHSGHLCALASEELDGLMALSSDDPGGGRYALAFDPLDGSSNIDFNISVGTIFSIHRRVSEQGPGTEADVLQPGRKQVAAGYVVYGSSTMFVYTSGNGVHGFTLDPTVGEFLLSHPSIRTPRRGRIYSINEGNIHSWTPGTQSYIESLRRPDRPGGSYTGRYVGSLVADFHRNLLAGGIFLYPGDRKNPEGKLRLLYEAAPLALIAEAAGGSASTGREPILDIEPLSLHQRVPLLIGSPDDVSEAEVFLTERD